MKEEKMGQFSWLDCKTKEQVLDDVERNVYVLVPEEFGGGHILETCYDGYGRFGGYDIYDLVVDWNRNYLECIDKETWGCDDVKTVETDLEKVDAGTMPKRYVGITLACYDKDNARLKYPIKITHDPAAVYEDCEPSLSDPDQGW
jgi:hypothetical protein